MRTTSSARSASSTRRSTSSRRRHCATRSASSTRGNAQGELYLTDTIAHIAAAGGGAGRLADDAAETIGINNRVELEVAAVLRDRINEEHMLNGVTIVDPATTWIDASVELEPDVVLHPFTVLRGTTTVAAGAPRSAPYAVAVDTVIGERVSI